MVKEHKGMITHPRETVIKFMGFSANAGQFKTNKNDSVCVNIEKSSVMFKYLYSTVCLMPFIKFVLNL